MSSGRRPGVTETLEPPVTTEAPFSFAQKLSQSVDVCFFWWIVFVLTLAAGVVVISVFVYYLKKNIAVEHHLESEKRRKQKRKEAEIRQQEAVTSLPNT